MRFLYSPSINNGLSSSDSSSGNNPSQDAASFSEFLINKETSLYQLRLEYNEKSIQAMMDAAEEYYREQEYNIKREARVKAEQQLKINKLQEKADKAKKSGDKAAEKTAKKLLEYEKKRLKALQDETGEIAEQKKAIEEMRRQQLESANKVFSKGATLSERWNNLKNTNLDGMIHALSNTLKQLDTTIDTIAKYQSGWSTRLYGSNKSYSGLVNTATGTIAISPYFTQEAMMKNINSLVDAGIAYNLEQRAFLMTISDKIATTFDAANGTLLQLVRVQQADSTASRLGLEASLNSYLNAMFQNTEYLSQLSKTVTSNLYEATSLFSAQGSIGFEYQIQKWLGSLYSVGMSSQAISNISQALGYLGSGNVSALAGSNMQNLLVMGASRAGLNYGSLLSGGLSSQSSNQLMQGIVSYLAEVAASGNNVVKSQLASIFGISISDLKAVSNLVSSVGNISKQSLGYAGAMNTLSSMMGTVGSRTSIGEMMSNLTSNLKYSMASGIASNPALYMIWETANILDSLAGGIPLPSVMGTGLNTTVADLMRLGSFGGGLVSSLGSMLSGGGLGWDSSRMLSAILGSGSSITERGTGLTSTVSTIDTSVSAFVGNTSTSDIERLEGTDKTAQYITNNEQYDYPKKIFDLLESVILNGAVKVRVEGIEPTSFSHPSSI